MNKQTKISDLCSHLHAELYQDIEPAAGKGPTAQQIQQAVTARLHSEQDSAPTKECTMKKRPSRIALTAIIICLIGTTAFAATGGLDYFKSLFGSTTSIEKNIWSPQVNTSNQDYMLTIESLLTDGFKTDAVVSITKLGKKALPQPDKNYGVPYLQGSFEQLGASGGSYSSSAFPMPEFNKKNKDFYHIEMASLDTNNEDKQLIIQLKTDDTQPLEVKAILQGSLLAKQITPNHKVDNSYTIERIQVSPLGVLVAGKETNPKDSLPTALINLKMADGSQEELMSNFSFDNDGGTVTGGGSTVVLGPGQEMPLVQSTFGERNPDGKIITRGSFSRALNLNDAVAIVIDGTEYPLPQ